MSISQEDDKEVAADGKNPLQEVQQKVAITPEDCSGAAEFWTQFKVPMLPELQAAFERFSREQTLEAQNEVKLQLCKAVGYTDHDAFRDEMFKEIVEECRNVVYDLSFNKSLESTLTKDEK